MSRGRVTPAGPVSGPPADDAGCPILHVDMDAFYASVELRRRPDLVGRPVIVGGAGSRGVVLSATYEARAHGVHSAMPMLRARRACPQAVVIPPDFPLYQQVSAGVMALFRSITPLVEPLSLDEAFLDVAGARRRLGRPAQVAEWIRALVRDEQGVSCSVGVASTKFVAKLASARCKPDGLLVVPRDGVVAFLHPLPVAALWGVGERTEDQLALLGLRTVGDLAATPVSTLKRALGQAQACLRVNELLNWQVAAAETMDIADASATKVFASERLQRLGQLLAEIVGRHGDPADEATAELRVWLDVQTKRNLVLTFGGGVNEIQRELIATFGLGLPRVPR